MTKKIRENLLILLISNIITIILFVTAPYIIRVVTSTNATENNNLMLSPLPILLYLILLSLLVCIITVLYRLHTEKRIIINNSITSLQPATSEKNKAEIMREIYWEQFHRLLPYRILTEKNRLRTTLICTYMYLHRSCAELLLLQSC